MRPPAFLLLLVSLAAPRAAGAAPVLWTGAGDGSTWGDAANWSPPGVPGPTSDVTIASNSLVTASASTAVVAASVELGNGLSTATLRLSTGAVVSGLFRVRSASVLSFRSTQTLRAGTFRIETGGLADQFGPVSQATTAVTVSADLFELQAGATIQLNGRGFNGGPGITVGGGPGGGGAGTGGAGAGGGGHGGAGGNGGLAINGGPANGSTSAPLTMGSGGGGGLAPCVGGAGGGYLRVTASSAVVNGFITADGDVGISNCSQAGGGGAGGGVRIDAVTLTGSGLIQARGSAGGNGLAGRGGGGGGGGRVALKTSGLNLSTLSVSVAGGSGGGGAPTGSGGTVGTAFIDPKVWTGAGGAGCQDTANWVAGIGPAAGDNVVFGSTAVLKACTWDFGGLAVGTLTIEPEYQGVLTWASNLSSVTGRFDMRGGTFSSTGIEFKVGGDLVQTGGVFVLANGTVTAGGVGASWSVSSSAVFNHVVVEGGATVSLSSLTVAGNLTVQSNAGLTLPAGSVLRARGQLVQVGTVTATGSEVVFQGASAQTSRWNSYGVVRASTPAGVTLVAASGSTVSVSGSLFIEPGATLTQGAARLQVGGNWSSSGTFSAGGGTVAFVGPTAQALLSGATHFAFLELASSGGVFWATAVGAANGVTFATGTTDLGVATHSVRGFWALAGNASFQGSSGTVLFEGSSLQSVQAGTTSRFGRFVSSNAAGVVLTEDAVVDRDIELHRGSLDISSRTVRVRGGLRRSAGLFAGTTSTLLLDGTSVQALAMGGGAVHTLVVTNSSAGARLEEALVVRGTFTVLPGAVFDGGASALTVSGSSGAWSTAGAVYRSSGPATHSVLWIPLAGTRLHVADGSTVAARLSVVSGVVRLGGKLYVTGAGNSLELSSPGSLDARGATVTLRDTSDLVLSSATAYLHDAGSYVVFEGSGTDRGLSLSTGPFGHIVLAPSDPAASFRFRSLFLDGSLTVASGTLRLFDPARLDVKGDFVNAGGTAAFAAASGSTLAFTGPALQTWRPGPADDAAHLEVSGSSTVLLAAGSVPRLAGLTLASGTLAGADARIQLSGDWTGSGGTFAAGTSTVSFLSAGTQTYRDTLQQSFHGLAAGPGVRLWRSAFNAAVMTATHPASALEFSTAAVHTLSDLTVNGASTDTPVALRSEAAGAPFRLAVARSTVTAARFSDADATAGPTLFANDGRTADAGRNAGVEFRPFLLVLSPGETFSAGSVTGRSGAASVQTAGTPFTVTVLAVSDRFLPVPVSSVSVQARSDDPFDTDPPAAALAGGSRTFSLSLRRAEPAPLSVGLSATGVGSAGAFASTSSVQPAAFSALQPLLPGETAGPGTPLGRGGVTAFQIGGRPFTVTVRAVDAFGNLTAGITDTVSVAAVAGATATIPAPAALTAGVTTFASLTLQTTGVLTLTVRDLSSATLPAAVSSTFAVFSLSAGSPTVRFSLPSGASIGTLAGGVNGGARDTVAVTEVGVSLRDLATGLWFDWAGGTFNQAAPVERTALVTPFRGNDVGWSVAVDEGLLTTGRDYFSVARASNPAGFAQTSVSTFTYDRGILVFSPRDGEGAAALLPATTGACQLVTATVTLTVGVSGLGQGGAAALRVPSGWTPLAGLSTAVPPPPGYVTVVSTSLAWTVAGSSQVLVEPVSVGSVTLGAGWLSVGARSDAANTFRPGERLTFHYSGFPPARGAGRHVFETRTRSSGSGTLVSVATAPVLTLEAGPAAGLEFVPDTVLALGPLQTSPTMQVLVTDGCGNAAPAPGPAALNVALDAGQPAPAAFVVDSSAAFFLAGGAPASAVSVASGATLSGGFYMRTATTGVTSESLRASATVSGLSFQALRQVLVRSSSVTPTAVSIDSGTLAAGATSVVLTPGSGARAVVRFGLADASVSWEVAVATEAGFTAPLFTASGAGGSSGLSAVWDGVLCRPVCSFVAPGRYHARVRAAGVSGTALEVRVATSPFISGTLGTGGAGAVVRAEGPGAGYGSAASADSSGVYRLDGLREGSRYSLTASTAQQYSGTPVLLTTAAFRVAASTSGGAAPALAFDAPALVRVSASISVLSPEELFGSARVRSADGALAGSGVLHFPRRGATSDDGGVAVGRAASTWTVVAVRPGTYSVELAVDRIGVSTVVTGVAASSAAAVDVSVALPRRAALSGAVVLASTGTVAVPVSLSARPSTETVPTRFAVAEVPAAPAASVSSGVFRLFGLAPGTWTVTARAPGFLTASTTVAVPSEDDVGDSAGVGGPVLSLPLGLVLRGTVTVTGDTRVLGSSFTVLVSAFEPNTRRRETAAVPMTAGAALSSTPFALGGLEAGTWQVNASVPGFEKTPGGAAAVVVPQTGAGAALNFAAPSARARLTVAIPAPTAPCLCAADFGRLAFLHLPPSGAPEAVALATTAAGASFEFYAASMVFVSPVGAVGPHRWTFLDRTTGRTASALLSLTPAATAAASLDLTGAVHTVSGRVFLNAPLSLSTGSASVSASSMAAVTSLAGRAAYCLLASSSAVTLPAVRVELVPRGADFPASAGPLAGAGPSCRDWTPAGEPPPPALAYVGAVAADGTFSVSSVPTGAYLVRVPGDVDGRAGDEAAPVVFALDVSGDLSVEVPYGPGGSVTGQASLPAGASGRRTLTATLTDREGRAVRSASFEASPGSPASFTLDRVPAGEYGLRVLDAGTPKAYAARPRTVRVAAGAADAGSVTLEFAGAIRGQLSVERRLSSASVEVAVLSGSDRALLPAGLSIAALASPWAEGGFFPASGTDCGLDGCSVPSFDAQGYFSIPGVLPGLYDVTFRPAAGAAGADLAYASRAGVRVEAAMTADLGVVALRAAASLSGTLADEAGAPAAGVPVEARPKAASAAGRRPALRALSDAAGRFTLGGLDPDAPFYDVVAAARSEETGAGAPPLGARPPDWEEAVVSGVDVRSTFTVAFVLTPARLALSGKVVSAGGAALYAPQDEAVARPGARLWLHKEGTAGLGGPLGSLSVLTAPDGAFRVTGLSAGSYRVTATARGHGPKVLSARLTTGDLALGTLTLAPGASLSGSLRRPDGSLPGVDEVKRVYAATPDLAELIPGELVPDPAGRAVAGYRVGGFAAAKTYRLVLVGVDDELLTPPEASALVFASTAEARGLDLVFKSPAPRVTAKSRRSGGVFLLDFQSSHPLRALTSADDDASRLLSTATARGTLSQAALSADRRRLSAVYTPGVSESSFTLRFAARSSVRDPEASDGSEFLVVSSVTFFAGLDGYHETKVPNLTGGTLAVEGDAGRLTLPKGAFLTDASSAVAVALRRSDELLLGARSLALAGTPAAEAAARSLRHEAQAYPKDLYRALAATPPDVRPAGPYYDVLLGTSVPTRLARPAVLTLAASAGRDPAGLNVYWYNEAANAFVLQQDANGAPLAVDAANRTVSLAVDHFSTFVLFDAAAAVISGNAYGGGELTAYNFPNPFDLAVKTVTPIHGAAQGAVRGTMIRVAVPAGVDGDARIMVFSAAGERVKTISLGTISGGRSYYQPWDGTNDSGRDVASGLYVAHVKVGSRSAFFKMAVLK